MVLGKVSDVGERVTAGAVDVPLVPERERVCVPTLSGTVMDPVEVPVVVGSNFAEMVQLPPAAMLTPTPGQFPVPPNVNGPEIVNPAVIVMAAPVLLVRVAVSTALVLPTAVFGKVNGLGEMLTPDPPPDEDDAPVPLRLTDRPLPLPGVMVSVAIRVPEVEGLKVTLIAQLPLAATLVPQLLV